MSPRISRKVFGFIKSENKNDKKVSSKGFKLWILPDKKANAWNIKNIKGFRIGKLKQEASNQFFLRNRNQESLLDLFVLKQIIIGTELLPQTLMFLFIPTAVDISNYEFCSIKYFKFEISNINTIRLKRCRD